MAVMRSRSPRTVKRVVPHIFDIPDGVEALVYDDNSEDIDEQGDLDDWAPGDDDENDPTTKPKKKKKKKAKKKKKNKGKKKKNKGKGKKKGKKNKGKSGGGVGKQTGTPGHLEVVKQFIRTKRDGSQVVDLTVEVERIGGADKYEFRVTKKDTGKTTVVNG